MKNTVTNSRQQEKRPNVRENDTFIMALQLTEIRKVDDITSSVTCY